MSPRTCPDWLLEAAGDEAGVHPELEAVPGQPELHPVPRPVTHHRVVLPRLHHTPATHHRHPADTYIALFDVVTRTFYL